MPYLTLKVDASPLGADIKECIEAGCKLASRLDLFCVSFHANETDYFCYPDGRAIKIPKDSK